MSSKSLAWLTLGLVLSLFFVSKPILPQLFTGLFSYRNQASFWQTSLQVHTKIMALMLVTPLMRMLKMMARPVTMILRVNEVIAMPKVTAPPPRYEGGKDGIGHRVSCEQVLQPFSLPNQDPCQHRYGALIIYT